MEFAVPEEEEEEWEDEDDSIEYVECFLKDDVSFIIEVRHDWAPLGAERFMALVDDGYFTDCALFRAVENFLVQFGLAADDAMREKWRKIPNIEDDPLLDKPFTEGMMSFAGGGKNSRGTQMFITLGKQVDSLGTELWETPFGNVLYGMEKVQDINFEYGDSPPWGKGPDQQKIWGGYKYLKDNFPNISYIQSCERLQIDYEDTEEYLQVNASYQDYLDAYYGSHYAAGFNVEDNQYEESFGYEYQPPNEYHPLNDILGKRKLEAYPVDDEMIGDYSMPGDSLIIPFSFCSILVVIFIAVCAWVNKKKSRVE